MNATKVLSEKPISEWKSRLNLNGHRRPTDEEILHNGCRYCKFSETFKGENFSTHESDDEESGSRVSVPYCPLNSCPFAKNFEGFASYEGWCIGDRGYFPPDTGSSTNVKIKDNKHLKEII